jgi:hypothetical protein
MTTLSACVSVACPKGLVGIENLVGLEAMGDQQLQVGLLGPQAIEQHRRADGIDQSRGDR